MPHSLGFVPPAGGLIRLVRRNAQSQHQRRGHGQGKHFPAGGFVLRFGGFLLGNLGAVVGLPAVVFGVLLFPILAGGGALCRIGAGFGADNALCQGYPAFGIAGISVIDRPQHGSHVGQFSCFHWLVSSHWGG